MTKQIDLSKIQWTGPTMNFWWGCKKKSAGCKYCYMYRLSEQWGKDPYTCVRTSKANWRKAYKWNREVTEGKRTGTDRLVFTCSMSDFFNEEADEWRDEAWEVIRDTPNLIWQILTKLPHRIHNHLPTFWDLIKDRIWLMTTVENQSVDWRIDELTSVSPRPAIFALSVEPMIGSVRLDMHHRVSRKNQLRGNLDWVIIGGESGNKTGKYLARPMDVFWVKELMEDCKRMDIPVFIKQMGSQWAWKNNSKDNHGGIIDEWEADFRVREFPYEIK